MDKEPIFSSEYSIEDITKDTSGDEQQKEKTMKKEKVYYNPVSKPKRKVIRAKIIQ